MQWNDQAIILSTRKYGESSGILSLISKEHGLFNGLVRGVSSKKNCGIYQTGNFIEATWRGRLSEHLGSFSSELQTPNAAILMDCPLRLAALNCICAVLETSLPEREPAKQIYYHLKSFIEHLKNDAHWKLYYILLEIELLSHLGFRLDLSSCAATGDTDNLIYISPKSGRAVSKSAGEPYKNKLLKMPPFLKNEGNRQYDDEQIINGLEVGAYFLEKYIYKPHNRTLPVARHRFVELIFQTLS
ncbi:MAG: DNA repair protein RecO [Rickettsiales bacterium]|nr:DNA repair protein RecO [Pseudomonadota bacterium]MDA0965972.1 DNA repair protein RecO [Pseudomonadota bacterium]MDG4542557.1 DNA repair protein RecO [Rickettsiales bacterium]MDG4545061.1 DNA repair protein RecO [Rickettsiales bacterium]MDG4547184.1 DNA repair protein RecO [Rickettsiales bacterium]